MRYLLDTHVFLWIASGDPRLTPTALAVFVDSEQECFLSAASVWEIAIKSSLGKLVLATSLARIVGDGMERGLRVLDVTADHAFAIERLPYHHRDPFDRLLVAQAIHEGMYLVSSDAKLDAYGVTRIWS